MAPHARTALKALFTLALVPLVSAQTGGPYDLTWNSFDAGGAMFSTGGTHALGGTVGQHDAGPDTGPLAGGPYSLVGGFWPASACLCISDLNYDKKRDGADIRGFIQCLVGGGANCGCADIDRNGALNAIDITEFVNGLLTVTPCP